jgi:hypothetical protein
MVLVLDELGLWPEMVRGIIAQEDIKRAVNCTGNVHIVLVGTGVEGVALDVGPSTDNYATVRMEVPAWGAVPKHLPGAIRTFI